jgi:hypothetical protein
MLRYALHDLSVIIVLSLGGTVFGSYRLNAYTLAPAALPCGFAAVLAISFSPAGLLHAA